MIQNKVEYIISESWHNRCDNGKNDVAILTNHKNAQLRMLGLQKRMSQSIGKEFEINDDEQLYCSTPEQVIGMDMVIAFIAPKGLDINDDYDLLQHCYSSEKRRIFDLRETIPCYLVTVDCRIDATDYSYISQIMSNYGDALKLFNETVEKESPEWDKEDIRVNTNKRFEAYKEGYEVEDHLYISLITTKMI